MIRANIPTRAGFQNLNGRRDQTVVNGDEQQWQSGCPRGENTKTIPTIVQCRRVSKLVIVGRPGGNVQVPQNDRRR